MSRSLFIASAAVAGLVAGGTMRLLITPADQNDENPRRIIYKGASAKNPRPSSEPFVPIPQLEEVFAARGGKRLRMAAAWLLHASAGEIAELAAKCQADRLPPGDPLWTLLMTRWAVVDTNGMIKWARGAAAYGGGSLVVAAWDAWTEANPAAAAIAARRENVQVQSTVLNALAATDPDAALAFARSLPEGEAALRYGRALDCLAAHWPDLEARLTIPSMRHAAKIAAVKAMALTDPAGALRAAARMPIGQFYNMPLSEVMKQVAATDPEGAAAVWESLPRNQMSAIAAQDLINAWALRDPDKALGWARKHLPSAVLDRVLPEIAAAKASRDPAAALQLLAESGGGRVKMTTAGPLFLTVQEGGITDSFGLGSFPEVRSVRAEIARRLTADQIVEAVRPVAAPGMDRGERNGLLRPILDAVADRDPNAALNVLRSGVFMPVDQVFFASGIFERIAQKDPVFAANALADSNPGPNAYGSVVRAWLRSDEASASAWVRELPRGNDRDGAALQLVGSLLQRPEVDFEAAFAWAGDIDGRKDREASADSVWIRWLNTDGPAAQAALQNSGLDSEKIAALQRLAREQTLRKPN